MGLLVNGVWRDKWYDTQASNGEFERQQSQFRHWVTPDGMVEKTGTVGFKAEEGRYHLYVSLACPWAHRTLIFRKLKKLETIISVSVVQPLMLENGWEFGAQYVDDLYHCKFLHQIYTKSQPEATTRVTVPVLWDKQQEVIVNNESAEIIRMFNSSFNHITGDTQDFYPQKLREEIDSLNNIIYHAVNNGVYRAGFATSASAYKKAFLSVFEVLDMLESRLASSRYLCGDCVTEADWRLFTTLVRFDAVYYSHFKTNRNRLADYACLSAYLRDLYQYPGISGTVDIPYSKQHYYGSHRMINPTGIVPLGPDLNYMEPHDRGAMGKAQHD